MSILDVVQEVSAAIAIAVPDAFMASPVREHVELRAVVNEMAQRIAFDTHDWSALKAPAAFIGDGVKTLFDMPSDYKRMLKKGRIFTSSTPYSSLTHYPDTDQWLGMQVQDFQPTVGGWTILGGQFGVMPAPATAAKLSFYYLSSNIVRAAAGSFKPRFTADTDVFRLDERLLKLGIIWQWRANKGLAYAEDLSTFEEALAYAIGSDKGSSVLTVGHRPGMLAETVAYPGVLGH